MEAQRHSKDAASVTLTAIAATDSQRFANWSTDRVGNKTAQTSDHPIDLRSYRQKRVDRNSQTPTPAAHRILTSQGHSIPQTKSEQSCPDPNPASQAKIIKSSGTSSLYSAPANSPHSQTAGLLQGRNSYSTLSEPNTLQSESYFCGDKDGGPPKKRKKEFLPVSPKDGLSQ